MKVTLAATLKRCQFNTTGISRHNGIISARGAERFVCEVRVGVGVVPLNSDLSNTSFWVKELPWYSTSEYSKL